jgi:hypothetical protein
VCNLCETQENVIRPQYVCKSCADVDLCDNCLKKYHDGAAEIKGYSRHEFLTVPREEWKRPEPDQANDTEDSISSLVRRLRLQRINGKAAGA